MRIIVAVLASLLLLTACGNEAELAAKKAELADVNGKLKALEAELAAKETEWQPIVDTFMEASQALRRAVMGGNQAARDAAQAVYDKEEVEHQRMLGLKSKLLRRKTALKRQKKKILHTILGLGGGDLEPDFE